MRRGRPCRCRACSFGRPWGEILAGGRSPYRYDANGTCTPGSGGGAYAVKCIEGTVNGFTNPTFSYDANGNMTAGLGRALTYTSYNMPAQVVGVGYSGGASTTYNYGEGRFKSSLIEPKLLTYYESRNTLGG